MFTYVNIHGCALNERSHPTRSTAERITDAHHGRPMLTALSIGAGFGQLLVRSPRHRSTRIAKVASVVTPVTT
ncbi:hypothetical protein [Mumia sp. ZJ430]|uniref:hypothetical protein n=1 Tax=Mumia sp. ZJ430 TaxID=2708083 RepID=UPI00142409E6|nr:hypothetical protein [Mumia sp. ZJ430]